MITNTTAPETDEAEAHWLLVIDHREARIFRSKMHGAVPQEIMPHDADDYFRHPHGSMDSNRGKERPDPNSFFEPIAKALKTAKQILVFGSGKGMSSEMEQFIAWAKTNQPKLAKRIIGSLRVDQHQMSRDQLLAKAREFYAGVVLAGSLKGLPPRTPLT
jgi:hypothetical protein